MSLCESVRKRTRRHGITNKTTKTKTNKKTDAEAETETKPKDKHWWYLVVVLGQ